MLFQTRYLRSESKFFPRPTPMKMFGFLVEPLLSCILVRTVEILVRRICESFSKKYSNPVLEYPT